MRRLLALPKRALLGLIRGYRRFISPRLSPACRFYPTCSEYALVCVERFGVLRGGWLAIKRICKCHPFHPGGIDLPPDNSVENGK
ncbi:MAG: membrane protein insertion efficiency factor YidD [Oscillospiraceae bacterium]|nr:membrane protein insertion efficiency factor YidD [Oscillospiraceae bacterium]